MNIELECGTWFANGYVIVGGKNIGYEIYKEEDYEENEAAESVEKTDDFEQAVTWVYNS